MNPDAKVYTNAYGARMLVDARLNMSRYYEQEPPFVFKFPDNICTLENDEEIIIDGLVLKHFFTPGHSQSCICWCNDKYIFTGDSYIPNSRVVTNLPGGNRIQAVESQKLILANIKNRIICPGHSIN